MRYQQLRAHCIVSLLIGTDQTFFGCQFLFNSSSNMRTGFKTWLANGLFAEKLGTYAYMSSLVKCNYRHDCTRSIHTESYIRFHKIRHSSQNPRKPNLFSVRIPTGSVYTI